jgi:hypothetical protein
MYVDNFNCFGFFKIAQFFKLLFFIFFIAIPFFFYCFENSNRAEVNVVDVGAASAPENSNNNSKDKTFFLRVGLVLLFCVVYLGCVFYYAGPLIVEGTLNSAPRAQLTPEVLERFNAQFPEQTVEKNFRNCLYFFVGPYTVFSETATLKQITYMNISNSKYYKYLKNLLSKFYLSPATQRWLFYMYGINIIFISAVFGGSNLRNIKICFNLQNE